MAVATYTATTFDNVPKNVVTGNQSVQGQVIWTAADTTGDIGFLCKVPHGATIVDMYEYHTSGAATTAISFGLNRGVAAGGGGNLSCFIASGATATFNRMAVQTGIGLRVSVSDLDPLRYAEFACKVENAATSTTSLIVAFSITYRMDGPYTKESTN